MRLSNTSLAVVAALTIGALAAPVSASAQAYGYSRNYGTGAYAPAYDYGRYGRQTYDPCAREREGRTGAGAVIGGGAGAVIGSQLAARGRRTEGSILGGVVGYRSRPIDSYQNSDRCRLAESRIRLPDGRTDTRYVRTCPDQYGRYRVVD